MGDIEAARKVLQDRRAPEREREQATQLLADAVRAQAPTSLEIIEELTPQNERDRLPIQVGRRYFHSYKDTERLYREVTEWSHFSLDICPADTPPPDTQAAFEDVFADLIRERGATLRLHPLYKRWTVFMREPTPENTFAYRAAMMIVEDDGKFGEVPLDLRESVDPRLHPIIAKVGMGSYKVPTRYDFEWLRYNLADLQYLGGAREAAKKGARAEQKQNLEFRRVMGDIVDDFVSHNAAMLSRDINRKYGSMQGLPFIPQTSLDQFDRENPTHELTEAVDESGKPLGYYYRRKLLPFERGVELSPHEKRMVAIFTWGQKWREEKEQAEKAGDRTKLMQLTFYDPSLTAVERIEMIETAEREFPGFVSALLGTPVEQAAETIESTIKRDIDAWEARLEEAAQAAPEKVSVLRTLAHAQNKVLV